MRCLEAEGVGHVFGIPGEETLDLNHSLEHSSIEFIPVRHEQAGAYMADAFGRLTGRAGVGLGTLGPGARHSRGGAQGVARHRVRAARRHALWLDVPSLIVVPIDYSVDVALPTQLGEETVTRT